MRWLTFAFLACLTICVQTTLASHLTFLGVPPEFMLILMTHYALHARTADGLIACWLLGLLVDLASVERLGAAAAIYGLIGWGIWSVRDVMFPKHPVTHFAVTAASCVLVNVALRLFFRIYYEIPGSVVYLVPLSMVSAVYSGVWAVLIHGLLVRLERPLGLRPSRRERFSRPPL